MIRVGTEAGQHINNAISTAIALSIKNIDTVLFCFNGIEVTVTPDDVVDDVFARWEAGRAAASDAWRKSPVGIASAKRSAEHLAQCQSDHDRLMEMLPTVVHDEAALMQWCQDFSMAADHIGVVGQNFPRAVVLMHDAGWRRGAHVGKPKSDFENPKILAEWVIGQAMECMNRRLPPHGITEEFVTQYKKMRRNTP